MAYNSARVVHDSDSHVLETPTWLRDYADRDVCDKIDPLLYGAEEAVDGDVARALERVDAVFDRLRSAHSSSAYRAREAAEIMSRKNFDATGSFISTDRARALDLLGFSSQLVFSTFYQTLLHDWEHGKDLDLAYGAARAHNRGLVDFCSADPRLLPTCYVPLADIQRAATTACEAVAMGAAALLVSSGCPAGHSLSHIGLDRVWAQAEEASTPVVFHVGGSGAVIEDGYFDNGVASAPGFVSPDEAFRSLAYMGISGPPSMALTALIFDGVLERFPTLRVGVLEHGAVWVPSWMRQMEAAFDLSDRGVFGPLRVLPALHGNPVSEDRDRLQKLSLRPSEYVQRQVRFAPHPSEDLAWIIENAGSDLCMFSSDYPHPEGGCTPVESFEAKLTGISTEIQQQFFCDNFLDLMGRQADS